MGEYREIFNSDEKRFGGSGYVNAPAIYGKPISVHSREASIEIKVAPFGVSVIELADQTVNPKVTPANKN